MRWTNRVRNLILWGLVIGALTFNLSSLAWGQGGVGVAVSQDPKDCAICVVLAPTVQKMISEPDDKILERILDQCGSVPEDQRTRCKIMVLFYGKDFVDYIRKHAEDPKRICEGFGFCKRGD